MKVQARLRTIGLLRERGAHEGHVLVDRRILNDAEPLANLGADVLADLPLLSFGHDESSTCCLGLLRLLQRAAESAELRVGGARPARACAITPAIAVHGVALFTPLARSAAGDVAPPDDFENRDRLRLALDDDSRRADAKIVAALQLMTCRVADDNPGAVLLVQRFEPRAEIHGVSDDGVAHDRI